MISSGVMLNWRTFTYSFLGLMAIRIHMFGICIYIVCISISTFMYVCVSLGPEDLLSYANVISYVSIYICTDSEDS